MRIAGTLIGLPTFAQHVLAHIPAQRLDPVAREMLADAAQGRLHQLWH